MNKPISNKTREKFKKWIEAVDTLSEEDQKKEASLFIECALNILNENNS